MAKTISYYGKEGKALLDTYGIRLAEAIDSVTDGKGAVSLFKNLGEDVRVLDVLGEYGDEAYDMLRGGGVLMRLLGVLGVV